MRCTGLEYRLFDCEHGRGLFEDNICTHSKDAGVECVRGKVAML